MTGDRELTDESLEPPKDLPRRDDMSLLVVSGPCAGKYFKIPDRGGVIGRDEDVEVQLTDPGVSREHAELLRTEEGNFEIVDLDSRYGVYVEGDRIEKRQLQDGDRIQLSGETVFRVRYQDPKESEVLARMQEALTRDELTTVYNRRYFLERLEQEYAFARRHRSPLALLMLDIDYFKRINDEYGHAAGDAVLSFVGRRLQGAVRAEDIVGRYGGDEFVICIRGVPVDRAEQFGERLTNIIRTKPATVGGDSIKLSISVGLTALAAAPVPSVMELVTRADAALYEAKRQGRDRVSVWSR